MTDIEDKSLDERANKAAVLIKEFIKTIAALRHPQTGCPWDLQQSHASLRRYMIEEAYEAAEAMLGQDDAHLMEELGDVLLQVVLNAQLSAERGAGDITEVIAGINSKMIRRHPHVFGGAEGNVSTSEVKQRWEELKAEEQALKKSDESVFAKASRVHPALTQAYQIGKKARAIDFDWDKPEDVLAQLKLEIEECAEALTAGKSEDVADELSDCFFTLAQLSRHLGHEPEEIAQRGNLKFLRRFKGLEELAKAEGKKAEGRAYLEELWQKAKKMERQKAP